MVWCLTYCIRKRCILFWGLLTKPYGEVETMFELGVFDLEAFFMIKTKNSCPWYHTVYANQFWFGKTLQTFIWWYLGDKLVWMCCQSTVHTSYLVWRTTRSRYHVDFSWKKARLVVADLTYGLKILTILVISVASNFKTDMKSPTIVYRKEILEIE